MENMTNYGGSPPEDASVAARRLLAELLEHMGIEGEVEVVAGGEAEGAVELRVQGEETGLLVGRKGAVLDALEFMVNRMLLRRVGPGVRVAVDAGDYRERRAASLSELALRLAREAEETGEVVALNPMSARDRRIVHMALKEVEGVTTRSEGEEPDRRLLIVPEV